MGNNSSSFPLSPYATILRSRSVPPTDRQFWSKLWELPTDQTEIDNFLTEEFVSHLRDQWPENLCAIIKLPLIHLHNTIRSSQHRSSVTSIKLFSATRPAGSLSLDGIAVIQRETTNILNCIRILQRVLSILIQDRDHPFMKFFAGEPIPNAAAISRRLENRRKERMRNSVNEKRTPTNQSDPVAQMEKSTTAATATASSATDSQSYHPPQLSLNPVPAGPVSVSVASSPESSPLSNNSSVTAAAASSTSAPSSFSFSHSQQLSLSHFSDGELVEVYWSPSQSWLPATFHYESPQGTFVSIPSIQTGALIAVTGQQIRRPITGTQLLAANAQNLPSNPPEPPIPQSDHTAVPDSKESESVNNSSQLQPQTEPKTVAVESTSTDSNEPLQSNSKSASASVVSASPPTRIDDWLIGSMFGSPLYNAIMELLTDCLFAECFTIPTPTMHGVSSSGIEFGSVWSAGLLVPASVKIPQTSDGWKFDLHRTEILKTMLVCCSQAIFRSSADYQCDSNPWIAALVSSKNRFSHTLCWSLVNITLNYQTDALLPYSYSLYTDYRDPLVTISIQLLLIILEYRNVDHLTQFQSESNNSDISRPPQAQNNNNNNRNNNNDSAASTSSIHNSSEFPPAHSPILLDNVFYNNLMVHLTQPNDLKYLYKSLCRLLHINISAESTYLPGSMKQIEFTSEIFLFFWKLIDENDEFLQFIVHQADILELITGILYFIYEARKDSSKSGLIYTCFFILLKLSGLREFAVGLNKTAPTQQLSHLPLLSLLELGAISGSANYADLLILVGHKLIASSPAHLDALLKVFLTTLGNISPYVTRLSKPASVKLLHLFELFSSPSFLMPAAAAAAANNNNNGNNHHHHNHANENNLQYCALLIDVLNNCIHYQYHGMNHLVFSIIRKSSAFYELGQIGNSKPQIGGGSSGGVSSRSHRNSGADEKNENESKMPATENRSRASSGGSSAQRSPAQERLVQWRNSLPLDSIYRLLEFFMAKIAILFQSNQFTAVEAENEILELVSNSTLVGILPAPPAILVRRYIRNTYTNLWFSCFLFGVVFLRNQPPVQANPLWNGKKVQMFAIAGQQYTDQSSSN